MNCALTVARQMCTAIEATPLVGLLHAWRFPVVQSSSQSFCRVIRDAIVHVRGSYISYQSSRNSHASVKTS